MAVKYTPEQQYAIDKRNADILVSAAAGSGKTAVLVERILAELTAADSNIGIDEFLCLTFTDAAASEMREKIYNRLSDYAEKHPEDTEIPKQLKKLRKSHISTIDSFVGSVVKSHYHLVDIDPNYRIITEGEVISLQFEVLEELFAEKYAEENADFFDLIEHFCTRTDDMQLKQLVLQVYNFASSIPYPEKWLKESAENFSPEYTEDFRQTKWGKYIAGRLKTNNAQLSELLDRCLHMCELTGFSSPKIIEFKTTADLFEKCIGEDFLRLYDLKDSIKIPNLTNTDVKTLDEETGTLLRAVYSAAQAVYKETTQLLDRMPLDGWHENITKLYPTLKALIGLVLEFSAAFSQKKRSGRIAEFDDIAHYALKILVDENGCPTPVAKDYQKRFKEVIIDEYQDCSLLQDKILEAVSGLSAGKPNRFMVGDIKQCIYKFRQANPEIFAEKYRRFRDDAENSCLIQLNKNFRSRENILASANFFFYQLMSRDFGGIDYTDDVALNCGASYFPIDKKQAATEIAYINTTGIGSDPVFAGIMSGDTVSSNCEAMYVANRIKALLDDPNFMVEDTKTGLRRRAAPRDIVILLRSRTPARIFAEVLPKYGIPVTTEQNISLFDALEVQMAVSYLKITDNPLRDNHLLTILFSPLYALTADELVMLTDRSNKYLYESAKNYAAEHNDALAEKLNAFFSDLEYFSDLSKRFVPLAELLETIYSKTALYSYAGLLSAGEQRQQNLDSLMTLAREYDNISSGDIYGFIGYLDTLSQTGKNLRSSLTARTDSVTIMTMHQSKGLEFPIVFLPQMCGRFKKSVGGLPQKKNEISGDPNIVLSQDMYIGMKLIEPEHRTVSNTLTNLCVEAAKETDELHESLRLLYVAMTRAREKLFMVGAVRGNTAVEKCRAYINYKPQILPPGFMLNSSCYMDWLLTALARSNKQPFLSGTSTPLTYNTFINDFDINCEFCYYNANNIMQLTEGAQAPESSKSSLSALFAALDGYSPEDNSAAAILGWEYPYSHVADLPSKTSISEIKKRYYEEQEESLLPAEYSPEYKRPQKGEEEMPTTGAARGTIYHTFMEHIDFSLKTYDDIKAYKAKLVEKGILTEKECSVINNKKIHAFLNSKLCMRIADALSVKRETAFTLGLTPYEVYGKEEYKGAEDLIHVDGIIDLFFEEMDGIVLIDYKTDHINGDPAPVMDRYKIQLELYARAIERTTGKKVKEKGLYLFSTDEARFYG